MTEPAATVPLTLDAAESASSVDGEAALVERARREPQAFAELYRMHYAALGRYLLRRTGDAHATEDLLSETFLRALRGLAGWRPRGVPIRYWLYRIATNAANRWLRRARALPRPLEIAEDLADPREESAAPELDASQRAALLALRTLTPRHQSVLALHYLEGLRVEEVASVLRCRVGTVKSRLFRARRALAGALRRDDGGRTP